MRKRSQSINCVLEHSLNAKKRKDPQRVAGLILLVFWSLNL